ncbi:tetratricopeptide repeat protein [Thermodesulfobacteriota bacterium]
MVIGCGVKQTVKGEYYLLEKKYEQGILAFQNELKEKPGEPKVHFYLGRLYLADNNPKDGLVHIKRATELEPSNADYLFWLGVAYSENKQGGMERKSYEKALALNPNHLQSRIYLAHNQLERKRYKEALANYNFVLKKWPDEPASLYNRALILNKLRRTEEEKLAWKEYLDFYGAGPMARRATDHLNKLGDFSYRNYLIGLRTVTMRRIQFEPLTTELTSDSKDALKFLGEVLANAQNVSIHIVAYQKNNKKLAEQRAKSIKKYLLDRFSKLTSDRLKVAWFGVPETIKVGRKRFQENESINFLTFSKK